MQTKIICITNPKGGVGKSTTAINLAAGLATAEKKVLLIDLDTNGSIGFGLGMRYEFNKAGSFELIQGTANLREAIRHYDLPPFDVIPCHILDDEREQRLLYRAKNRNILKQKLSLLGSSGLNYDFVLIDTPPLLNEMTVVGLTAANSILIPMSSSYFGIEVTSRFLKSIQKMRNTFHRELFIEGILLNNFDKRTRESRTALKLAQSLFGEFLYQTIIPKNTTIGYAAYQQKPVILHDATARGSRAFLNLAGEFIERAQQNAMAQITKKFLSEPEAFLQAG